MMPMPMPTARRPFPELGVVPQMAADANDARTLVQRDGAAIISNVGHSSEDAKLLGHEIFGQSVLAIPEAAEVTDGGVQDRRPVGLSQHTRSKLHTDGYSYGNFYPDYFLLLCDESSDLGGESFLMDGLALLDWTAAQADGAWFVDRLLSHPIDQTEPGKRPAEGPLVGRSATGRIMFRRFPEQQPTATAPEPEVDRAVIARWQQLIDDLSLFCPRFKLEAGQALVIDNYRLFHGRESYADFSRRLWRLWVWTTAGEGVPEGLLHSDSRYAGIGSGGAL